MVETLPRWAQHHDRPVVSLDTLEREFTRWGSGLFVDYSPGGGAAGDGAGETGAGAGGGGDPVMVVLATDAGDGAVQGGEGAPLPGGRAEGVLE